MANVNDTITDGSVVWIVEKGSQGLDGFLSGAISTAYTTGTRSILLDADNKYMQLIGGTLNYASPSIRLFGSSYPDINAGRFQLLAKDGTNTVSMVGTPAGGLTWNNHDLAGSAIVAKSLTNNGYIKYASGLIIQWGLITTAAAIDNGDTTGIFNFNIQPTASLGQMYVALRSKAISSQSLSVDAVWISNGSYGQFRINASPTLASGATIAWYCICK